MARLTISIGARAAAVRGIDDREAIFANAHCQILEDLVERGHYLREAAAISDDIIAGARKIVAESIANGASHG